MEDIVMMNIIHENHLKSRNKTVKSTKITVLDKILITFGTGIFLLGLMYLIAIIENLKF